LNGEKSPTWRQRVKSKRTSVIVLISNFEKGKQFHTTVTVKE
jgi:hypothetical protein